MTSDHSVLLLNSDGRVQSDIKGDFLEKALFKENVSSFSLEVKTTHFSEMTSLWLFLMVSGCPRSLPTAFPVLRSEDSRLRGPKIQSRAMPGNPKELLPWCFI